MVPLSPLMTSSPTAWEGDEGWKDDGLMWVLFKGSMVRVTQFLEIQNPAGLILNRC